MNMTLWGKAKKRSALVNKDEEIEEITIPDEDVEDWRVVEEEEIETDEDQEMDETGEPGHEDCDWQEVYSLNGCSTYFG